MEFHCDKFSKQRTWLSIIKCLWQVENILKYLTLLKVILICVMNNNQVSSVTQSWLCDPMDCSMPGFPVHHQLLEFTQTHVLGVGDAIQSSHPLSFPSPSAFNLSHLQSFQMSQFFTYQCTKQQPWTSTDLAAYIYCLC